jgi:hypothetical protein
VIEQIAAALIPLVIKMVQNALAARDADEAKRAQLRAEADAEYEAAKAKIFGLDAAIEAGDAIADAAAHAAK